MVVGATVTTTAVLDHLVAVPRALARMVVGATAATTAVLEHPVAGHRALARTVVGAAVATTVVLAHPVVGPLGEVLLLAAGPPAVLPVVGGRLEVPQGAGAEVVKSNKQFKNSDIQTFVKSSYGCLNMATILAILRCYLA
jgi:hypothetical protein